jgi:hypothetical protein
MIHFNEFLQVLKTYSVLINRYATEIIIILK